MIKKGRKYICKRDFNVSQNNNNNKQTFNFHEGNEYISPRDGFLVNKYEGVSISPFEEVCITPEVADLNFRENQVDHPSHYNTNNPKIYVETDNGSKEVNIECIDVIRNMPSWKGNIIKYAWRAGLKEEVGKSMIDKEIEDLEKIKAYANDRINQLELKKKIQ